MLKLIAEIAPGPVFDPETVDVLVGAFDDAPTDFTPAYELWTPRRERWLAPIEAAEQHVSNRA